MTRGVTTVLYLGGHALCRDALAAALARSGFRIVPAVSLQEAVDLVRAESPAAVLIDDAGLGDQEAINAVRELVRAAPDIPAGVVSSSRSPVLPADAINAGATAYLTKEMPLAELPFVLERMVHGQLVVDPVVTRSLFGILRDADGDGAAGGAANGNGSSPPYLTPVERRVLSLAADGYPNDAVARRLGLSPLTVKNHLARIRARLGAADKAQAVAVAMRSGLLD